MQNIQTLKYLNMIVGFTGPKQVLEIFGLGPYKMQLKHKLKCPRIMRSNR